MEIKGRSGGTVWLVVELPGTPGYISTCRVLFDRRKMHEISGDSHSKSLWGAVVGLLQLPIGLAAATRFPYAELLKVNARECRQGGAKGHLYLLEIWLLHSLRPSSEVYQSHYVRERIIWLYSDPTWNCLHSLYCAQHPSSGYNQAVGMFSFDYICYFRSTRPPERIVRILFVIVTTHFPVALRFIDYSRWKYRWVSTSLWSENSYKTGMEFMVLTNRELHLARNSC